MKGKLFLQSVCGFILFQLSVSATFLRNDSNLLGTRTESADDNSSDNLNAKKTCDIILNFSNMEFKYIGSNFISSLYVTNLTLRNNSITKFEKGAFDSLPNLDYLDVSKNQLSLTELFSFGGHSNLKTLILNYNTGLKQDTSVAKSNYEGYRYYTTTVATTTASSRKQKSLEINPSYYFPELENLSLRKVNIDSLSADWIFNFPKLKYLDLSENNFFDPSTNIYSNDRLIHVPPTTLHLIMESVNIRIFKCQQLKNITMLNLNDNYFENISNLLWTGHDLCLRALNSLQFLFASNCSISTIDINAFKNTPSLLQLDISNNKIAELPSEIFHDIPSLEYLDLSKNNLKAIPDFGVLKNLSSLKLDNMQNLTIFNSLDVLSSIPNLNMISMRNNKLKVLSSEFLKNLPALREIDLSHNEITSLPSFMPESVLRKLYLSFNQVSNIEDLSLKYATSLEILDLRNNLITGVKIGTLKMLPSDTFLYL